MKEPYGNPGVGNPGVGNPGSGTPGSGLHVTLCGDTCIDMQWAAGRRAASSGSSAGSCSFSGLGQWPKWKEGRNRRKQREQRKERDVVRCWIPRGPLSLAAAGIDRDWPATGRVHPRYAPTHGRRQRRRPCVGGSEELAVAAR